MGANKTGQKNEAAELPAASLFDAYASDLFGGLPQTRTGNLLIKSQLLYH
jgi:hypothetical protein